MAFPFWNPSTFKWDFRSYGSLLLRPTLASMVQIIRDVFSQSLRILGFDHYLLKGIRKPEAGIVLPVDGLAICTNSAVLSNIVTGCAAAAGQQKFRKAADLARPL